MCGVTVIPSALLGGGSTSAQPAVYAYGGNPAAYQPTAQPQFDTAYQNLVNSFISPYTAGTTAPQVNYPFAQGIATPFGQAGETAAGALPGATQNLLGATGQVSNIGQNILDYLNQWTGGVGSPYYGQALAGAQTGAGIGGQSAQDAAALLPFLSGLPQTVASLAGPVQGLAGQVASGISPLQGGAGQVLNTAFDPQQALYNQLVNQQQQQANAANAAAGVAGPYAASTTNQALQNLALNWKNQQLQREATGLGAAGSAYGTAGNLGSQAGGLYGQAANLYGMAPQIAGENLALGSGAANLAANSAALPSRAFGNQWEQTLANLSGIENALPGAFSAVGAPYSTASNIAGGAFTPLSSANALDLQQYTLPQMTAGDILPYLQLGQSAGQNAIAGGQVGYNQQLQNALLQQRGLGSLLSAGIGGGSIGNLLYGSGGLSGALGLNPSTGLLGGLGGGGLGAGVGALSYSAPIAAAGGLSAADLLALPFFG